ncbi:MAG TPA: Gfo/Idh/MocA family oxidoreductase [Ktedonosporobacter sp.]|nr:Gfo/Idh/MocA family oxidoreductase [Ktedonosporobacter sp.]
MTLRIIQVGLGGWGQSWAVNIVAANKDVETVAWVEIDEETLQQARQRLIAQNQAEDGLTTEESGHDQSLSLGEDHFFTSLEEALSATEAEAVLITASLPGHVPATRMALQAGKHVLLEKPFAPTSAEALELVELAERQGRILMVSQNYRFIPAVRAAAQVVRDQVLGDIGTVSIDFRRFDHTAPFETHRHYKIWEPLLADMAIHHFDLMRLVLGQEPVQVFCKTWNTAWSKYVEPPAGTMTITFDGGAVVNYRGSWISMGPPTDWAGEWHMEGEHGELVWTGRGELPDAAILRLSGEEPRALKLPRLKAVDRAGSLDAFVQAVQNGTTPETSGRDNLKTLAFMFAAIESARTGLPVDIG